MLSTEALILAFIIFTVGIIMTGSLIVLFLYLGFALLLLHFAGTGIRAVFVPVKKMIPLLIMIFLMNGCFSSSKDPFFVWWIFTLTKEGFHTGAVIVMRTLLIVLFSLPVGTLSSVFDITNAMEHLLYPLKFLFIPVGALSLIFSLIFSFVSILGEETERIKIAQRLRGLDLGGKGFRNHMLSLKALSVPLFLSAFSKADELSFALESRGYDPNKKVKRPQRFLFARDYAFLMVSIVMNILFVLGGQYVAN